MRVGDLFSGIGGFSLAARWMGWRTAWFSEIEPYASAVLRKHWPDVPNLGDITAVNFAAVEPVDVLVGGFPCQDISNAGGREGISGSRSGLWSHYQRAIGDLRPRYVIVENVAALLGRGLGRVLGDLAALGYDAQWDCVPASAVGAPHRRDRIWIVAYPVGQSVANPAHVGRGGCVGGPGASDSSGGILAQVPTAGGGGVGGRWWGAEPAVGRVANGVPNRVDRLRGLGNAIVPQIAYGIFQEIAAVERSTNLNR